MGRLLLHGAVLWCLEEGVEASHDPGWRLVIVLSLIHHVAVSIGMSMNMIVYIVKANEIKLK